MISNQHPLLAERSAFLELRLFYGITSNQHFKLSEGSTFLCYFIEVATGYCWSTVPYSVLFGTTLQSHLTKGFLHRPAGEHALIRCSTTSAGNVKDQYVLYRECSLAKAVCQSPSHPLGWFMPVIVHRCIKAQVATSRRRIINRSA